VGALVGVEVGEVVPLLEDLSARCLVTAVEGGRWLVHDLVRAFGAGMAVGDEEEDSARARLLAFYLERTNAANDWLRLLSGDEQPEFFADLGQALKWLDTERSGLVATVTWTQDGQFPGAAVPFTLWLRRYLDRRRYFDDALTVSYIALNAAEQLGDPQSLAVIWTYLGTVLEEMNRLDEAINAHVQAQRLFQTEGHLSGEASTWNNLGAVLFQADQFEEAIHAHTRARELHKKAKNTQGEGIALDNLGITLSKVGRPVQASDVFLQARALYRKAGDRLGEARACQNLGAALTESDQLDEAIQTFHESLRLRQGFEDWYGEAETHINLALAHTKTGQLAQARAAYLQAADAYTRANAPTEATKARASAAALPLP